MYWVFEESQVKSAMKQFVERTCADVDEQEATAKLLAEFLTSDDARQHGMVHGDTQGAGDAAQA